ncbi:MAG TPA: hypothetical protein VGF59_35360 [Bryobacteraceae bacterium]
MHSLRRGVPIFVFVCFAAGAQVNVLTANGGVDRANANLQETILSPATVNSTAFGKLATFQVDGQIYSQPLYVSGLTIPGKGVHNVLFVTTMHNTVYAFDADSPVSGNVLWQASLGASVPSQLLFGRYGDIGGEVGILSTGAIDLRRGVFYVVAEVLQNGVPAFSLHALDLTDGSERLNGPIAIQASVAGTGSASANGAVKFGPMQHLQRSALLLANDCVYVAFGSHADQSPYHGWLISYSASDLTRQNGVFMSTPDGDKGAFWQSGRGPAADDAGNIYAITGNGDFDGARNFSQSFLKLSGAAPVLIASLTPLGWKSASDNDADLSAGPALVAGTHTEVAADKNGVVYVLDTAVAGEGVPQTVYQLSSGSIFNLAVWSRPGNSLVYIQGEREPAKAFQLTGADLNMAPVSTASFPVQFSRIGMTLSANGAQDETGILWETTGNYNDGSAPGALHALDASNLSNELWNSDMNSDRDAMPPVAKFANPTVVNGKVFVATFGNAVVVYGLLPAEGDSPPDIVAVLNAASFSHGPISPGELVSIFGSNLGPSVPAGAKLDDDGSVTTLLSETQVLFDGMAAPLLYVSQGQINAVAPFEVSESTDIEVVYLGLSSDPATVPVTAATPGIFSQDASGSGQGIIVNQDGSLNSANAPAALGTIVTFYATGAGLLSPDGIDGSVVAADNLPRPTLAVDADIGGRAANVRYAGGAPGMIEGVIQVNLEIPADAPAGFFVLLTLRIGGQPSQSGLTIAVR